MDEQAGNDALLAICPACGAALGRGSFYCGFCGSPVVRPRVPAHAQAPPASPVKAPTDRRSGPAGKVLLVAGAICVMLLVLGQASVPGNGDYPKQQHVYASLSAVDKDLVDYLYGRAGFAGITSAGKHAFSLGHVKASLSRGLAHSYLQRYYPADAAWLTDALYAKAYVERYQSGEIGVARQSG